MFWTKKKQESVFREVDDTRATVYDFRLRTTVTGFESYRTRGYRLYEKLAEENMLPALDEHLEKLFSGNIDEGNANVLDQLIFSAAREALPDLKIQYLQHRDTWRRLRKRSEVDMVDLQETLEQRKLELALLEEELKKVKEARKV